MTSINTNVASLRGLRNFKKASDFLGSSLERLSTGLKINSGKDNPSGLIASETLGAQITSIKQSIKNSNRADNVIGTADAALSEISGLLNQVRGLVQEGLNNGALSDDEIKANQLQIDAALGAVNRISANTKFAGDKLIDGSKAFTTATSTADAGKLSDYSVNEALFGSNSTIEIGATVTSAAEKGRLDYSAGKLSNDTTLEVSGSKGSQVLFLGGSSTVENINEAINAVSDVTGVNSAITTNAVAGTSDVTSAGGNNDVTFTDARTTQGTGVFSEGVSIVFADPGANNQALGLSVATDANGDHTITVNLATNGDGTITTNADQVLSLVNGNAQSNALVTASLGEAAGTGTVVANAGVTLADGTDGVLSLTSQNFGSREFVDVNVLQGSFATTDADATVTNRDAGTDIGVNINGLLAKTEGLKASIKTATLDASLTFATGTNTLGATTTLTVTGGGSLFQIGQDATVGGQIGLGLDAVNTARLGGTTGKLYELSSTGGKSLLDVGTGGISGADLIGIVEESINEVSTLRGRLGALQKNVIETNINSLGVALENISSARSQIVDTDFAEETANMTKGQILSQAGLSVLGIANQNPSQVLSLLG